MKTDADQREVAHGRRSTDRLVPLLALMVIVLFGICAVLSVVAFRAAQEAQSNTDRLDAGARAACERLQRIRDDLNVQADGQYDVIVGAAHATTNPQAKKLYSRVAADTEYSPPSDCKQATDHPLTYQAPPLVPWPEVNACFSRQHPRVVPPCKR